MPTVNLWKRSMSITGTWGIATAASSGRWVITAPTSSPPFDPPFMASRSGEVQPFFCSHSAAAMKSSKMFCFLPRRPASYQAFPYSPPPRRLATAYTPPISSQTARDTTKAGSIGTLNPP